MPSDRPPHLVHHLLTLVALAACGVEDTPQTPLEHGRELYVEYCGHCHGDKGEGYAADNANALANEDFLALASDDFLRDAVIYGRPGTPMSGWGEARAGPLSDADVDDLVAYMRTAQDEPDLDVHDDVVEGTVAKGESVYAAAGCPACHGDWGQGNAALSLNNPWFLNTASDGYLRESIRRGRRDTTMGAYGDTLTELNIDDLVALIRSWEVPVDETPLPPYTPTFDPDEDVLNPGGEDPDFVLTEERFVSIHDVNAAIEDGRRVIMLDARAHSDFVDGHIVGAVSIPFYDIEVIIDELPKDTWIVTYCGCPHTLSGLAFDALKDAGFDKVAVLDEGYFEWVDAGYPVEPGE
jgi:cytochrome c oxidase cbb3-type subunit 3/ubiquinol-cytochrome c reductase cytochrome c subunit